ncbi:MAG: DNA/RNA non-specific endonuclease [Anaerolineales bacterium]|nr:DNA/RNA non-specific endonuclease [Anaerolineales bacterium]
MDLSNKVLSATLRRARILPKDALTHRKADFIPQKPRNLTAGDVSNRASFLTRGGAQPTKVEFERLLGTNDLVDEFYLERALLAANPVCRISIRTPSGHERGAATGFMISPKLLLTNEHVFGAAEEATSSIAEFNYRYDIAGRPELSHRFRLRPDLFFFNDETLDFALVSVEQQSLENNISLGNFGYHRLIPDRGKILLKEWMTIIQHPGGARRQFAIRENECINIQDPDVIWYKSDTAQGSSGSPVLNDSFQVVALHNAGVPRRDKQGNYFLKSGRKVKDISDVDDSAVDWIANAGIRISRICACINEKAREKNGHIAELKEAMLGGDVISSAYQSNDQREGVTMSQRPIIQSTNNGNRLILGTLVLELNGNFNLGSSVTLPTNTSVPAFLDQSSQAAETYKEPIIDTNYDSRTGFDINFLGIKTPLPSVVNQSVIARTKDGRKVIPYEHFSLVMHKNRKLAIFTAANVDGSAQAKKPEPGKSYDRDVLNGYVKGELEKWVLDPRLDEKFQIPDGFYTKDNGAFDKGHIVRRDDVCFGLSFSQVQRANGDTFHVTNCSPQRGNFNRSNRHGIWGQLENFIGAQSDKEQYCIFAGPVMLSEDKTFSGTEKVQIPERFWKVVCATKNQKLQVFAFVLEQQLSDLPLEFHVDAEWKPKQLKLKDLEKIVKLVKFPKLYHDADQR